MLILLWMTIQYEAISRKVEPKITAVYIRKLAKEKFGHMQELLKSSLVESEKNYLSARQSVIDTIRASAEADEQKREIERLKLESERNIRTHYDRDLQMAFVIDSIRACYDYSDLMIRKAYAKAEAEEGFITLNRREATKRVLHYLEKPTKRVKKRVSVQQEEKQDTGPVSYTHHRAHETVLDLVCRLLLDKKKYAEHRGIRGTGRLQDNDNDDTTSCET